MKPHTLVARSLRFHWRSHLGVVLGAAVATAVLVGALVVGDSVRWSLRRMALARIGQTQVAMATGDRFFLATLADRMAREVGGPAAPVLLVRGVATRPDGTARINQVQVLGVDGRFWKMAPTEPLLPDLAAGTAAVNEPTARALKLKAGDTLVLRVQKPSALPLDAPLSGEAEATLAMPVTVTAVAAEDQFGGFSLAANQVPPYNVFVPLGWLQKQLGPTVEGRANVLLAADAPGSRSAETANIVLKDRAWRLEDAQLKIVPAPSGGIEIRTDRVFLDTALTRTPSVRQSDGVGILTYFVNELRVGDRTTPYSMVAAVGILSPQGPLPPPPLVETVAPAGMADDAIIINAWLANDLAAKVGDMLEMTYWVPGPGRTLETQSRQFKIRAIEPMDSPAADPTLMPDFPGLANVEDCHKWQPGVPIDLKKIRPQDEAYWKQYRGTPKAFVTLAAGQRMWANRFGDLTSIRWSRPEVSVATFGEKMVSRLDPASLGLYFHDVRARALAASGQGIDFGQLFLGLSFFLAAAALVLTGLLFAFNAEQRAEETGTLLALGYPPRRVRRLMLAEGAVLALAGGLVGTFAGLVYTRVMLYALATVWASAVGSSDVHFHAAPLTVVLGAAAGVLVALVAIGLTVRRQARAPARELLAAGANAELRIGPPSKARGWLGAAVAAAAAAGAVALLATTGSAKGEAAAGAFFGIGALLLVALLGLAHAGLAARARAAGQRRLTFTELATRGVIRRRTRSLATVAMVACGAFLVVAVGANRKNPLQDAALRSSGTGGFALFGETTLPLLHDLTSAGGRKAYALPDALASQLKIVPLRVHEGDDASCLNLNRPQQPRLLGVRPEALAARGAFTFAETVAHPADENPWMLLARRTEGDVAAAIGDQTTLTWSLGKAVGDEVPYTDARGRPMRLRIVGALAGSILQGSLIISEDALVEHFPSESGYRMLLIDAPPGRAAEVSEALSERLSDVGLALAPAAVRLAELNAVENTYLDIFQALGGLGLVLGSIGLGVVVLRNVMERRGELALMRAVGFSRPSLVRMVLYEHWGLLAGGLAAGVVAALVAVMPAVRGADVPCVSLGIMVAAVAASGLLWTWLAARFALRGPLLDALRNE